ncbi:hypothetical protein CO174_04350 [Candidatus Uhrbacteria bacterium CG_4_9_14_3_um_filter_50_9]|uniref:Uncharacterized protein n=1 Tax=Candidatus Uhrbacteria bacterium CG_4_9_14_3_um_filter_50_9 TaxID=1975035 RepID=A0A2M7XBJ5_9BACT|nr:MAG: hypothetical protein CO174_04350 [Candidatus Uhrbacteria bacterium CG_4_9_14_3_um_filter_50_9]
MKDDSNNRARYSGQVRIRNLRGWNGREADKPEPVEHRCVIRELPNGRHRVRIQGVGVGHVDMSGSKFNDQPFSTTDANGYPEIVRANGYTEGISDHLQGRFNVSSDDGNVIAEGEFDIRRRD